MKWFPGVVLLLLLAGCASNAGIPGSRTDRTRVRVEGNAGSAGDLANVELTRQAAISSDSIAASPERTWTAVPAAFAALEIPVTDVNTAARLIASTGQRVRRIGGKSMASYFNCPGSYGNLASSGDVFVTVRTQVLPGASSDQSLLRMEVEADARSGTGSSNRITCTSTGSLEKLIRETIITAVEE